MDDFEEPKSDGEFIRMTYRMVKDMKTCTADHEERIRKLEGSFWKVIGLASLISFVAGLFGGKLNGGS